MMITITLSEGEVRMKIYYVITIICILFGACAVSGLNLSIQKIEKVLIGRDYDYIYNLHFRMNNISELNDKLDHIISYLSSLILKN